MTLDRRTLTISGEKKQEQEDKGENVHRVERSYGASSRMLQLSVDVDPKNIDATYKKGVLKLVFNKIQSSETKKIDIKSG